MLLQALLCCLCSVIMPDHIAGCRVVSVDHSIVSEGQREVSEGQREAA